MNERTGKAVAFLGLSGSISFLRIVPTVESAAHLSAIAWVPEVTLGLLWAATGVVGALGELTSSDAEYRDSGQLPSYVWGWASLLVAMFVVGLGFGYLTEDYLRFGAELVAPIGALITYLVIRHR
ncbi:MULTISPECIES: hypothetical protein [Halomicrobium]|uniref:Uncharacterized protein n=2 Tax=Halomicrobium mukohataei TaxID=57705 RepID=C7NXW2_HALMD|nr:MULTISPECIES: hypothetical protein [Halomicrobium]ACV46550.1 hypothetical protein Hmuk_0416 [Halomicrobium mukohataei DSM 12286]QCD65092.1 hypothetical protein E5139_05345 [Halomicrobium mukohataei]QFR19898.1 hypothetical protein GBQ70_05340 [Halomicrobium sp. ZPS1]